MLGTRALWRRMRRAYRRYWSRWGRLHSLVNDSLARTKVIKAFETLGFKSQARLEDYFLFPDGESRDIVLMTMTLRAKIDEF
jgi:hypothetical protein